MEVSDRDIMSLALNEAISAFDRGECPVGAVIVKNGIIIAKTSNREEELNDPTAHAEILALREAGKILNKHTFRDCVIYTTLWPCPMCANAMLRAKIPKVICGAKSFKFIYEDTFNPSHVITEGPIMNDECRDIFVKWAKKTNREFILEGDS